MNNDGYQSGEGGDKQSTGDVTKSTESLSMKEKEASAVVMPTDNKPADKPYSGMGKEDLLRFSDTPFWNTLRLTFLIIFWVGWVALLGAVIGLTIVAPRCDPAPTQQWWQKSTFYQIYVRSFYDTDENGVGDIKGVTEKLDYLQSLHIEAILLSSFYESPTADGSDYGYEVVNHKAIDIEYGTIEDFNELVTAIHDRGMKIIIDFIPNHTGDQHPWFQGWSQEEPPYEDFYTASVTGNINNWKSVFTGSAWEEDVTRTNTYYLHQLLVTQPELNLRNQLVMNQLESILRYWLDAGVDGFRIVGAKYLVEDYSLTDEVQLEDCQDDIYQCYNHNMTASQSENFGLIARWRSVVNEYNNNTSGAIKILLSDAKETIDNTVLYYGLGESDGSQLPLNYLLVDSIKNDTCGGQCIADVVDDWLNEKPDFATFDWMTGHQDQPRLTSFRGQNFSTALSVLRMTLPGSPIVYYGEELGMVDGDANIWPGGCSDPGFVAGILPCRDQSRTPMQWDSSPNAGFTNGSDSWIPANDDYITVNVQDLDNDDEYSPLVIFKKLADMRNTSTALQYGNIHFATVNNEVFSFIREYDGTDRYLVSANFGKQSSSVVFANSNELVPGSAEVVIANRNMQGLNPGDEVNLNEAVELQPGDAIVLVWPYSRP